MEIFWVYRSQFDPQQSLHSNSAGSALAGWSLHHDFINVNGKKVSAHKALPVLWARPLGIPLSARLLEPRSINRKNVDNVHMKSQTAGAWTAGQRRAAACFNSCWRGPTCEFRTHTHTEICTAGNTRHAGVAASLRRSRSTSKSWKKDGCLALEMKLFGM